MTLRSEQQPQLDPYRARIREALVELVAERGLDAVSLEMVADRAGLPRADVQRRYQTLERCFDDAWEQIATTS